MYGKINFLCQKGLQVISKVFSLHFVEYEMGHACREDITTRKF